MVIKRIHHISYFIVLFFFFYIKATINHTEYKGISFSSSLLFLAMQV